ncbi:MAG: molybdenum ABC transporter permease subunit [Micrococcales bacterium 73-13]|nr:MAG: molybdenum ABC transporter permease subunit [Micrococcales bacterium 73-13]
MTALGLGVAAPRTGGGSGVPLWLAAPAFVGVAFLVLPLTALVGRADWSTLWSDVMTPATLEALWLSIWTALLATAICALLGIPLAICIARARPWLGSLLRAITTIPLILPPMVGGVALLYLLGRNGWLGQGLSVAGVQLPFTSAAVVLAQAFVAFPFLVLAVEGAVRGLDPELPLASADLGATPFQTLLRVTIPLAGPGIAAGLTLCFARAAGEFGATALFAGNSPGTTRTMPLAIYTAFNGAGVSQGTAIALALVLLVVAIAVLILARAWRPAA